MRGPSKAENPEQTRSELIGDYKDRFTTPYIAASRGFLDDVIDPAETRPQIIRALEMLRTKSDSMLRRSTATSRSSRQPRRR